MKVPARRIKLKEIKVVATEAEVNLVTIENVTRLAMTVSKINDENFFVDPAETHPTYNCVPYLEPKNKYIYIFRQIKGATCAVSTNDIPVASVHDEGDLLTFTTNEVISVRHVERPDNTVWFRLQFQFTVKEKAEITRLRKMVETARKSDTLTADEKLRYDATDFLYSLVVEDEEEVQEEN